MTNFGRRPIITEFDIYIAPDGTEYYLSAPDVRWSFSVTGTGLPPIDYISLRGPYQHGETVVDYFLRPRTIQMVVRHNRRTREGYWGQRLQLLDALRPNRQSISAGVETFREGRLRKLFGDGRKLDIDVFIQQGPAFQPDVIDRWDQWSFQEVLRFIAHNPVFYDPVQHSTSVINTGGDSLVFPLNTEPSGSENTFDGITGIVFSASSSTTTVIDYQGSWEEYPTILVTGPIVNPTVTNLTTGDKLMLNYSVQPGEVVTFTLAYGFKTITLGDGTNLIGFLSPDSDLATFRLVPGINEITVTGSGMDASTGLSLDYFDRYIGY